MNTHAIRIFVKRLVLLAVVAFVAASCTAGEIPKFNGSFAGGLVDPRGKEFALVCVPTRKAFESSFRAGFSSRRLLEGVAKDANDFTNILGQAKVVANMGLIHGDWKGELKDGLLIVLLPRKERTVSIGSKEITFGTFTPGALATLKDIESAFGTATEKERFEGDLWAKLGFDGLVCWWQDVGVAVTKDGAVTHVLLRAAP